MLLVGAALAEVDELELMSPIMQEARLKSVSVLVFMLEG